jgi:hypothetical protein
MKKNLTLMNFIDAYKVVDNETFFLSELKWIINNYGKTPSNALLVSYAYAGKDFKSFFNEISSILSKAGISNLIDIASGDPQKLISKAEMIIVCGGNITQLIEKLKDIAIQPFDPYESIKKVVDNGIPYVAWNEGCELSSAFSFKPGPHPRKIGFKVSPYPIICDFTGDPGSKKEVESFLLTHPEVCRVICQAKPPSGSSSTVRLEDVGSGLIDSISDPATVKTMIIVNGTLLEI